MNSSKTLPLQPVKVEYNHLNYQITFITDGTKTSIGSENSKDFPKIEVSEESTGVIDLKILKSINELVKPFSSSDELRPAMCGVYLGSQVCATDGHRLAVYPFDFKEQIIVPKSLFDCVNCFSDDDIIYNISGKNLTLRQNNTVYQVRLIDERFPDYQNAIPKSFDFNIKAVKSELIRVLQSALIFTNKTNNQIKLTITGSVLNVSAQDLDFNKEFSSNINLVESNIERFKIGLNCLFLLNAVKLFEESEITLRFNMPNSLVGIDSVGNYANYVMPLMLNEPVTA